MQTRVGLRLRIVSLHQDVLRNGLRVVLMVIAPLAWVAGMLSMLGLGDATAQLVDTLYHAEIAVGSTSIELTGVWAGLAVILGTLVLVKIVAPLLELEIVPRLSNSQGLPIAVATVTRYLLVTAGTLLAIAAMGVDLTKVTVLAGALGVGIGFGLQSVVNNFVSGLILLIERPINVGDIVQMGQLRGTIRRIGVRSSTVQIPQGAEVIVPNADLISKEVTNWTLSDRKRRVEIDVGVAYDCEPDQVVKLLEAAAKEVTEVLVNPPPCASCVSFGDSALGFRLEAWVDDYDRGGANESALRMIIVRRLKEAGIEIPNPQHDIHIRTAPTAQTVKKPDS
jgi:potassium efflux system protein